MFATTPRIFPKPPQNLQKPSQTIARKKKTQLREKAQKVKKKKETFSGPLVDSNHHSPGQEDSRTPLAIKCYKSQGFTRHEPPQRPLGFPQSFLTTIARSVDVISYQQLSTPKNVFKKIVEGSNEVFQGTFGVDSKASKASASQLPTLLAQFLGPVRIHRLLAGVIACWAWST